MKKSHGSFLNILVFVLIAALLLSVAFVGAEADHHCTGEGCHICEAIRQCLACIRLFGFSLWILVLTLLVFLSLSLGNLPVRASQKSCSLVSLKIKLSC